MSEKAERELKRMAKAVNIPEDVLRAICRLEAKRIWREQNTPEKIADRADDLKDRLKEEGKW